MTDFDDLSGVVDQTNARVLNLEQQMMAFPTDVDWATLATLNSSRFNSLDSSLSSIITKLNKLEQYAVGLKLVYNSLNAQFTGHTGHSAASGHSGLTGWQ